MMLHPLALLLLFLAPVFSRADGCLSPKRLLSSARICEDNFQYQNAGQACLARLEQAVRRQRAATSAALTEQNTSNLGEGKNRQAANFAASGADYTRAEGDFESLIAAARETRASLEAYRDGVVFPSDWQESSGSKAELLGALWSQPCYATTAGSLDTNLDRVEAILAELEAAKVETAKLGKISGDRLNGLAARDSAATAVRAGRGTGSAAAKAPRTPASRSTITGSTKKATLPDAPRSER